MFCKKCGTRLEDNAAYCYMCGCIFEEENQPQPTAYSQDNYQADTNFNAVAVQQQHPKKKISVWYKVIIPVTAVILVATIALSLAVSGVFTGGSNWFVEVPDVVGKKYDKADSVLSKKSLHCLITDKIVDANIDEDKVVNQNPTGETVVGKGGIVDVVISAGAEKVYLPDVTNCSSEYVETIFGEYGIGIEYKKAKGKEYEKFAPNSVCYYKGDDGEPVRVNETVTVFVKSEEEKQSEKISVPNLVGMSFEEAQNALYEKGIYLAVSGYEYNEKVPENQILVQRTNENEQIEKGSTVFVTVSLGKEKIYIPDVTYTTEKNAKEILANNGIKVKVELQESREVAAGTVISQKTEAGTQIEKGTEVTLVVSSGFTVTVPYVVGLTEKEAVKRIVEADLAVYIERVEGLGVGVIEQSIKAEEKTRIGNVVILKVSGRNNENRIGQVNSTKDSKDKSKSSGEDINFGNVVKVDGKVYYWKYNSSSFENKSVYQNYTALKSARNQLVCRDSSGKEDVVMEAPGAGNLSLVGDRFFYNVKDDSDYGMATYTCKTDGSDAKLLDSGELMAITADNKYAICDSKGIVKVYDTSNLNKVSEKKFNSFVACGDNKIVGASDTSVVSYDPDGSNEVTLYSSSSSSMAIIHPYIDNGYIYFATGSYSGSGGFFDGGKIIKAKLDGSDTKSVGECTEFSKEFTVDSSGNVHVDSHYSGESDHTQGKNMVEPYIENYSIGLYDKDKNEFDFVITKDDYIDITGRKLGYDDSDGADHSVDPYFVQKVDDKVYFLLHKGIHTSGDYVPGGRYQYTREKSFFFEKDLKSGKTTLLYEF